MKQIHVKNSINRVPFFFIFHLFYIKIGPLDFGAILTTSDIIGSVTYGFALIPEKVERKAYDLVSNGQHLVQASLMGFTVP